MKKLILLFLTGAFILGLSSCEEKQEKKNDYHKKYKRYPKKQRYEKRW